MKARKKPRGDPPVKPLAFPTTTGQNPVSPHMVLNVLNVLNVRTEQGSECVLVCKEIASRQRMREVLLAAMERLG